MEVEAQLMQHLERLCVEIGPRPIGSRANHAAAEYIGNVFRQAGLEVEEQPYACRAWEHGETYLEMEGERIAADANAFSPPCDVSAATVAVGTVAELELAEIDGRIAILYGDLTKEPLSAKSWFLKTERDGHIIQLLEHKKPAALITLQAETPYYGQGIEDWEFLIPSVTVSPTSGLALLRRCGATVHLRIDSRQAPGSSCNVVARTPGDDEAARIVLCAHYDTKMDTPGASDNGGGVAVLLTLARALSQKKLKHGLEFIAFTGEEYLPIGDDEYLRRCGDRLERIVAAINLDGVGHYLGATSIMTVSSSDAFQQHLTELTKRYPGMVWVEPWPESNHSTFSMRGVPSVALSAVGSRGIAHYPADTVEGISPAKLAETASVVADLVEDLQDKTPAWCRTAK